MEEKLIEIVKTKPFLWNIKDKGYKHHHIKEKTWTEIGRELGISGEKAKKRFKSLRDYYRSQKNAYKHKSGSEAPDDYCSWKYYNLMKFLDDSLQPRKTHTVIEQGISPLTIENTESLSEINFDYSFEETSSECAKAFTTEDTLSSSTARSGDNQIKNKKSVKSAQEVAIAQAQEQFKEAINTFKEAMMPRTHVRAFFESIALQVEHANLNAKNWLYLQEEIFKITLNTIRQDKAEKNEEV